MPRDLAVDGQTGIRDSFLWLKSVSIRLILKTYLENVYKVPVFCEGFLYDFIKSTKAIKTSTTSKNNSKMSHSDHPPCDSYIGNTPMSRSDSNRSFAVTTSGGPPSTSGGPSSTSSGSSSNSYSGNPLRDNMESFDSYTAGTSGGIYVTDGGPPPRNYVPNFRHDGEFF